MPGDHDPNVERKKDYLEQFADLPGQVAQRSNEDITKDVESALFYDQFVHSYGLKIDCSDGVVTLSGTVGSELERARAAEDAQKVPGVKQVMNQIEISQESGL